MIKLAIIGAGYLQLSLVVKAKELGVLPICFAWEDGAVCKDICYKFYPVSIIEKEKILEICSDEQITGVTSIASDIAVPTVCFISEKLGLTGNSVESSLLSTNKYLMRKTLKANNINVPNFENYKNIKIDDFYRDFKFPVISKPVDRSGSKGITFVSEITKLQDCVNYALNESLCGEAIIEEFIVGEEISVESISFNGKHHILAFTDKVTTGYPHFVEIEHHQPSKFWKSALHDEILKIVTNSLKALNIQFGASHSELIITKKGEIYVTEIGARMGGDFIGSHLVQLSTGFDFLKAIIDISFGKPIDVKTHLNRNAGVCFYSKETEWVADFVNTKNPTIIESRIDQLAETELKESSQRSGYFIYSGNNKISNFF